MTFLYTHTLIRRNVISRLDGLPDYPGTPDDNKSAALVISGCSNLVAEENVATSANPKPIQYKVCRNERFFDNKAPSGTLVPGVQTSPVAFTNPELSNDVLDSEVLAI